MRKLKEIAGEGNYYYMSTDSLMVNEEGRRNLYGDNEVDAGVMGKLSLEAEGDSAWIGGCHFYRIGDKFTEGAKKASAETIDKFTWKEPHFDSLKSALQRGGQAEIHIKKLVKRRSMEYRKGKLLTDGTVIPFGLESIDSPSASNTSYCY